MTDDDDRMTVKVTKNTMMTDDDNVINVNITKKLSGFKLNIKYLFVAKCVAARSAWGDGQALDMNLTAMSARRKKADGHNNS